MSAVTPPSNSPESKPREAKSDKSKQCPKCGKRFPAEYQFCAEDATPLTATPIIAAPMKRLRPQLLILAVLALLAVVISGVGIASLQRHAFSPNASGTPAGQTSATSASTPAGQTAATASNTPPTSVAQTNAASGRDLESQASQARWQTYRNAQMGFQVEFPAGWRVIGPTRDGPSLEVSFRGPAPHQLILIGVDEPAGPLTPLARWQDFDARFARSFSGHYQRLGLSEQTLGGAPAARWEFTVQKAKVPLLRKVDVGAQHNGRDYALLCAAPPEQFPERQADFEHVIGSFAWTS